jgi:hypothetical protein
VLLKYLVCYARAVYQGYMLKMYYAEGKRWSIELVLQIKHTHMCVCARDNSFDLAADSSALQENVPKTGSFTVSSFQYAYWFHYLVFGYLDFIDPIELL